MDSNCFTKNAFSFLTLFLFISKNVGICQESTNYHDSTNNPNIRQYRDAKFDLQPSTINALPTQSFEDKLSLLKSDLDNVVEFLRSYYNDTWYALTQQTTLNQVLNLLHHSSLNPADHGTLVELKHCTEDLDNKLDKLKESFVHDDERHKLLDIITMLRTFKPKINEKIETMNRRAQIALLEPLIHDCVNEIMALRFDVAEKKLREIDDHKRIELVVERVYNRREENFYTLLHFAHSLKNNPEDTLVMYKALYDEMNCSGHRSLSKLLLIMHQFMTQISEQMNNRNDPKGYESLKNRIESFSDILKNSTKTAAINEIADAFILNYLPKLELNIAELDRTGFFDMNRVIEAVIDRISRKLDTKHLSSVIRSNKGICVNETTPTPLTSRLKKILSWSKYCTLSQDIKKLAQRAINSSPVEIEQNPGNRCEKVCIMNVNYNEYLYDPDESECLDKHTNISCPAYTTDQSISKLNQLAWNLKPLDDQKWDDERRSVSTRQISEDGDKYEWKFESDGDFVFIKNSHYQEYLTASVKGYINNVTTIDLRSKVTTSKRLRKVFTFTSKKLTPDCYWTLVECPPNS